MSLLESFEQMSEVAVINESHLNNFPTKAKEAYRNSDSLAMRQIISGNKFADTNGIVSFSDAVMAS